MSKNKKRHNKLPEQKPSSGPHDDSSDSSKLRMIQCKFWKFGKCNWGWGCRFLHGNVLSDDPRRPEYKGPPIDFTQFPRPMTSSSPSFFHPDDQIRSKPIRNPVVKITISNENCIKLATTMKELLLRNNIDVLKETNFEILTHETATSNLDQYKADFIMFIDTNVIIMLMSESGKVNSVSVQHQLIVEWIHRHWRSMNYNFTAEELELMPTVNFEILIKQLVGQLANLEDFTPTVSKYQEQVRCAIASQEFESCKIKEEDLLQLRSEILSYFGKLNLAYSIITDFTTYGNSPPAPGTSVSSTPDKPNGISVPLQKVLLFLLGQIMTQIHVCLTSINKLLGEQMVPPSAPFAIASGTNSPGLTSSPFCFVDCASLIAPSNPEKAAQMSPGNSRISASSPSFNQKVTIEFNNNNNANNNAGMRRIEPDISVDVRSPYKLSFRDHQDTNTTFQRPFRQ